MGLFEHPLNEFKSVQVTRNMHDFYDSDPKRGFYGGGGIDARFQQYPIVWGLGGLPQDAPQWGSAYKHMLSDYFNRTMMSAGHTTSLPVETNRVTLDPTVKDDWGLPALRITYTDHPDDIKIDAVHDRPVPRDSRCGGGPEGLGSRRRACPAVPPTFSAPAGWGRTPRRSVIDPDHRTHDVPNLFLCDGSSMVTSGRGQPTMTIMALAFRAGERIANLAKRGEI